MVEVFDALADVESWDPPGAFSVYPQGRRPPPVHPSEGVSPSPLYPVPPLPTRGALFPVGAGPPFPRRISVRVEVRTSGLESTTRSVPMTEDPH